MTYVLTCGCKSEYGGFPSEWDSETRECEPAVSYGCLCDKHFSVYEARPAQYQDNEDKLGTLEEAIEFDKKRNYQYTAPVAWTDGKFCLSFAESDVCPIPLYTAPRELSDDEIVSAIKEWGKSEFKDDYSNPDDENLVLMVSMIRAILKKASE
jgi:hypothetical protein